MLETCKIKNFNTISLFTQIKITLKLKTTFYTKNPCKPDPYLGFSDGGRSQA